MAGDKKARKQMSKAREAALLKVRNAKSPQEKTVAEQELRLLRFKEVASHRVGRVLAALDNLHAVTDAGMYSWDQTQAKKIIDALGPKFAALQESLTKPAKRKQLDHIEYTCNGAAFIRTGRYFTDGLLSNNVNGEALRCNAEGIIESHEFDSQGNIVIRKTLAYDKIYVEAQMLPVHPQRIEKIARSNIVKE